MKGFEHEHELISLL